MNFLTMKDSSHWKKTKNYYVASREYPKLKLLNRISSFLDPTILLKIYEVTFYLFLITVVINGDPAHRRTLNQLNYSQTMGDKN